MATSTCDNCNSWTVKGASFCHSCGCAVATTFEHSTDSNHSQTVKNGTSSSNWKDKASTTLLLAMAMATGSLFADFKPSYIALVPMAYLIWPIANRFILDALGKLPDKSQLPSEVSTTLKLEYKTEDNRHWLLADFPSNVELCHIQHIAKICLPTPLGEGANFSRRNCKKNGTLSQGQYEAITKFFLETNFAFYRDPLAPNLGILLTERASRLLKKSLQN